MIDAWLVLKASIILAAVQIYSEDELFKPQMSNSIANNQEKVNQFFQKQNTLQLDFINSFFDKEKLKKLESDKTNMRTMMGIIHSYLELQKEKESEQ